MPEEILDDVIVDGDGAGESADAGSRDDAGPDDGQSGGDVAGDIGDDSTASAEAERRESQSFKDKYYKLLEDRASQAATAANVASKDSATKPEDEVAKAIEPYWNRLVKSVESGSITREEANSLYIDRYEVTQTLMEAKKMARDAMLHSATSRVPMLLESNGVKDGTPEAKEVKLLLKQDYGIDLDDPVSAANAGEMLKTAIKYTSIAVKASAANRAGGGKPKPRPAAPGNDTGKLKQTPVSKLIASATSLSDITRLAREGKL